MSKEITKANILQEIQDKLKLREFDPTKFLFDETVVPIYDIGKHLKYNETLYKDVSITAGPAGYLFYTVPDTEKWTLNSYNVVFMAAGAYTVTGLYINRTRSAASSIYLDMTLGATASYAVNLPKPAELESGDSLHLYIDSYTSPAALRLYVDVTKETIR